MESFNENFSPIGFFLLKQTYLMIMIEAFQVLFKNLLDKNYIETFHLKTTFIALDCFFIPYLFIFINSPFFGYFLTDRYYVLKPHFR